MDLEKFYFRVFERVVENWETLKLNRLCKFFEACCLIFFVVNFSSLLLVHNQYVGKEGCFGGLLRNAIHFPNDTSSHLIGRDEILSFDLQFLIFLPLFFYCIFSPIIYSDSSWRLSERWSKVGFQWNFKPPLPIQ